MLEREINQRMEEAERKHKMAIGDESNREEWMLVPPTNKTLTDLPCTPDRLIWNTCSNRSAEFSNLHCDTDYFWCSKHANEVERVFEKRNEYNAGQGLDGDPEGQS
jgi:hypothetical protein